MRWTFRIFFVPVLRLGDLHGVAVRGALRSCESRPEAGRDAHQGAGEFSGACAYRSRGRLSAITFTRRKAAPRSAIWTGGSPPMRAPLWSIRSSSSLSPPRPSSIFSMTAGRSSRGARARKPRPRSRSNSARSGSGQDLLRIGIQRLPEPDDPVPGGCRVDRQFRVTMRLSGTTWRLTGIDLPKALREELISQVRKKTR